MTLLLVTLDDIAARQDHLHDLMEWLTKKVDTFSHEYKTHKQIEDKQKLLSYERTLALVKGYIDSFTKPIETVEEPVVERRRLSDKVSRYNALVDLLEMWRDAAQFIKELYAKEPKEYAIPEGVREQYLILKIVPTHERKKINQFEKAVELIEIYEEQTPGLKNFPCFKDGSTRILKPLFDEAFKIGLAANKKRILDAIDEKIEEKIDPTSGRLDFNDIQDDDIISDVT